MAALGVGLFVLVRHPMYLSEILVGVALLIITGNAVVGLGWLAAIAVVVLPNLRREEEALVVEYGEPAGDYLRSTGRFIPRVRAPGRPAR